MHLTITNPATRAAAALQPQTTAPASSSSPAPVSEPKGLIVWKRRCISNPQTNLNERIPSTTFSARVSRAPSLRVAHLGRKSVAPYRAKIDTPQGAVDIWMDEVCRPTTHTGARCSPPGFRRSAWVWPRPVGATTSSPISAGRARQPLDISLDASIIFLPRTHEAVSPV